MTVILYGEEGLALITVTWTWFGIGSILFLARTMVASLSRQGMSSLLGIRWDYIYMAIAYVLAVLSQAFVTISYVDAVQKTTGPAQLQQLSTVILWSITGQMCAIVSMIFGRISVISFLVALQGTVSPNWRKVLYALGFLQAAVFIVQIFVTLFQCEPARKLWDIMVPGECRLADFGVKYSYFSGSFGAFVDVVLAIYPAVLIIGPLQKIKKGLKIAICVIMGGGIVAAIAGISMVAYVGEIHYAGGFGKVSLWALTSTWFIIIFGTLPTVRTIFVAFGETFRSLWTKRSEDRAQGSSWIELRNCDGEASGSRRKVDDLEATGTFYTEDRDTKSKARVGSETLVGDEDSITLAGPHGRSHGGTP